MEFSQFTETSADSTSSGTCNKSHITIARKLQEISRRVKYAQNIIRNEGCLEYGGCTAERVGPPAFIKEPLRSLWRKDIRTSANRCVWNYLLPEYIKKLDFYKEKATHDILGKINSENKEQIERGIQLGIDRANKKWDKREGRAYGSCLRTKKVDKKPVEIGPHKIEEIGLLIRGEVVVGVEEEIGIKKLIKQNADIYRILAHTIYGSVRYYKIVVRNLWKYIDKYSEIEKRHFVPFIGKLTNNTYKKIETWNMLCAYIRNRDIAITTFELEIISRLYDVRIKIFRIINEQFICTWSSSIIREREIKILFNVEEKWEILVKITTDRVVGDKESLQAATSMSNKYDKESQTNDIVHIEHNVQYNSNTNNNQVGIDNKEGKQLENRSLANKQVDRMGIQREKIKKKQKRLLWQDWRKRYRNLRRNKDKKQDRILQKEGTKEKNKQLVFDYTTDRLKQAEIELLSRGESFCVANHKVNEDRLKTDIYNYSRRLRLHEEFREPKIEEKEKVDRWSIITQTQRQSDNPVQRRDSNRLSIITQTQVTNTNNHSNSSNHIQQRGSIRVASNTSTQPNRNNQNNSSDSNVGYDRVEETQCNNNSNHYHKNKVRKPASVYDPDSQNRNLNRYLNCISEESLLILKNKSKNRDNITQEEREALDTLRYKIESNKIIISKADKGSGLVAVDYDVYINKGTKYIEEEAKAYEKVEDTQKNIINRLIKYRNNVVQRLKNNKVIEVETATYCNKQLEEKITGVKFYYKVHKDTNIETMPLRPLQSCINAPTHHLSQVLTDILQPYLKIEFIPTYIQDSNQLLYRLENLRQLDQEDTLISSDVAALYPSIPHREGLDAITDFLINNTNYDEEQVKSIVKALELVITENYVIWNNQIYKQTSGVAMGTPVAVAYANIFMQWIDGEIRTRAPFIKEHIRYIDDNLFILPSDRIEELMNIANSILTPNIRFTYDTLDKHSDKGLAFLDTQLFITEEGKIISRLYTKKTDKHAYLLPSSYHPIHITKNIPLAVFNRIRRLCSKEEWFEADASMAIEWLEDRQYKYKDIKKAIETSASKDRWTLIKSIEEKRHKKVESKNSKDNNLYDIPYLVTYGKNTLKIKQVLKQRQSLLDASFTKTKIKPRLTFRRQRNINDLLIQKSLRGPITTNEEKVFKLCGERPKYRIVCPCKGPHDHKICRCCAHARLKIDGIKTRLNKSVDCDTKNIIYMIGCQLCNKRYIGETQQKLKDRLLQHLNNITKLKQPLYIHFNQTHEAKHLYITILETVNSEEIAFRKIREAWWINRLQTLEPRGFNVKLECSQIYEASHNTIQLERQTGVMRRK